MTRLFKLPCPRGLDSYERAKYNDLTVTQKDAVRTFWDNVDHPQHNGGHRTSIDRILELYLGVYDTPGQHSKEYYESYYDGHPLKEGLPTNVYGAIDWEQVAEDDMGDCCIMFFDGQLGYHVFMTH